LLIAAAAAAAYNKRKGSTCVIYSLIACEYSSSPFSFDSLSRFSYALFSVSVLLLAHSPTRTRGTRRDMLVFSSSRKHASTHTHTHQKPLGGAISLFSLCPVLPEEFLLNKYTQTAARRGVDRH
jgi:hypothetical protein